MDIQLLKKNFEGHGFKTSFFETGKEAAAYLEGILKGETIGFGGSMTAKELGLDEVLAKENRVIWHWLTPGAETLQQAREANVYICSANGVSETGELVNIDGTGNRVAMTVFGPKKTFFLVGCNKITPNLTEAIFRAKHVASPKNALRFNKKTPCVQHGGGTCFDCSSPERICKATVILERPCNGMEVEVVFINEEFGF